MSTFYVINSSNSINQASSLVLGALHLTTGDNAIILSDGYVIAQDPGTTGIYLDGYTDGSTLTIEGMVYSKEQGVYALGQHNTINVLGSVYGGIGSQGTGNSIDIGAGGYVSGGVSISGDGTSLSNAGMIDASGLGVQIANAFVTNTGTITGGFFNDGDGSGGINNTGTVVGGLESQVADTVKGTLSINNSGFWEGNMSLPGGDDYVTNTGTITDGVSLGSGNDILDNTHGQIFGSISGGDGNDTLIGGAGDETFDGGAGADIIDGHGGENGASYTESLQGVYIDLTNHIARHGDASGDTLKHIQDVTGSLKGDTLIGNSADNTLNGYVGNDTLSGLDGDDTLIMYAKGNTQISGGNGDDTIDLLSVDPVDFGKALSTDTHVDGGAGIDTLVLLGQTNITFGATTVTNVEQIQLSQGFDYTITTVNATVASGKSLSVDGTALLVTDKLVFNGSAETNGTFDLNGGAGADYLTGGAGNDTMNGGGNSDTLTGGAGSDTFVYDDISDSSANKYDTIVNLDATTDKFHMSVDVIAVDAAVSGANLSSASLGADLHNALAGHLLGDDAITVTASSGTLSGHTFLVVDGNGTAGYQSGADFLMDITGYSGTIALANFV